MKRKHLLLLFFVALVAGRLSAEDSRITVAPVPGEYDHDILVSLTPPGPTGSLRYAVSILTGPPGSQPAPPDRAFLRYEAPLFLSALPGERRTYRLDISYEADGKILGTMQALFAINRAAAPAVTPPTPVVTAPAVAPRAIPLLSPVPGSFGNEQLLYVVADRFAWVRYTLDGSDPAKAGTDYSGPVLLPKRGRVTLRVAALGIGASAPLQAKVDYEVTNDEGPLGHAATSGLFTTPFTVTLPAGKAIFYTFREHSPDEGDIPSEGPIQVTGPPGGVTDVTLRLRERGAAGRWSSEVRYFFVLDRRSAPEPRISLEGGTIATPRTSLDIQAADYLAVRYTTDGSDPTRSSALYTAPFHVELPPDETGDITVKARAFAPNGETSPIASRTFSFSTKPPTPPQVTIREGAADEILTSVSPGMRVVYECTFDGSDPPEPSIDSPKAPPEMELEVPRGLDATARLRFATVDATGAVSPPTKVYTLRIDRMPPPPPLIHYANGKVSMEGTGTINYTVFSGSPAPEPFSSWKSYSLPFALAGTPNELDELRILAVAVDEAGNRSDVADAGPFAVDERSPALPEYWGVENGSDYPNARQLHLRSVTGLSVHYTLARNGTEPPDPTLAAPVAPSELDFTTNEGETTHFVLKLLPAIGERTGTIVTLSFTIDRTAPRISLPSGFAEGGEYDRAVVLSPPAHPSDEELFMSLSEDGAPGDPLGPNGMPFDSPVRVEVPAGAEKLFSFRLGARDNAGNTSEDPAVHSFTIDRIPPPPPQVTASPATAVSQHDVTVTLSGEGVSIRYEILRGPGSLPQPTMESPQYEKPILLKGAPGRELLYSLSAVAVDRAGNVSPSPSLYRVVIAEPAGPAGEGGAGSGAGLAAGQGEGGSSTSAPAGTPPGASSSPAGGARPSGPAALVRGVDEGGLYNSPLELSPATGEGVLRYTIDANGGEPPEVSPFSPRFPSPLRLDPPFGDTRRYTLRLKLYGADETNAVASETLSFTIDRTPPAAPTLTGITDNARYDSPRTITLESVDASVRVAVDRLAPFGAVVAGGSPEPAEGKFVPYTAPIPLGSGENGISRYRIRAYSVDEAGNRSLATPEWTVYFDHGVVYAAPDGSDANPGTSTAPVRSLARALALAHETGRSTLFLASGSYPLAKPTTLRTSVSILAGFDEKSWRENGAPASTVITPASDLPPGEPMFSLLSGGLSLANLSIDDQRAGRSILLVEGGRLSLSNVLLSAGPSTHEAVAARGGSVTIMSSILKTAGGPGLVRAEGGSLRITDSRLTASSMPGAATLIDLAAGCEAVLVRTSLDPGNALRTASIRADHSRLTVSGGIIAGGTATATAIGIFAAASDISVSETKFEAAADSRVSFGVQAIGSRVSLDRASFAVAGQIGATGVYADDSEVALNGTIFRTNAAAEYLYPVKLVATRGTVSDNLIVGSSSGDYVAIAFTRSTGTVVNNTLSGGSGRDRLTLLLLDDSPSVDIADNILVRPPETGQGLLPGSAIEVRSSAYTGRIIANDFFGFGLAFRDGAGSAVSPADLDSLNGSAKGGRFDGNFSEPPSRSFLGPLDFHLAAGSACIGSGVDPTVFGAPPADIEGRKRSAPFDVGAYAR